MTFAPFAEAQINLCTDRVPKADSERQRRSAIEILRRLERQPGVVLADEVGMGKTFVAMAVAASIIIERGNARPVVVMVPPTLKEKWPKDWQVFCDKCLTADVRGLMRQGIAESGLSFLRFLDEPPERRPGIIFITHGALHRALDDGFAKLAVIKRAFKWRTSLRDQRGNFPRFAGRLLRMSQYESRAPGLFGDLMDRPCNAWLSAIRRAHDDFKSWIEDDPVPFHFEQALDEIDGSSFDALAEALAGLPLRESPYVDDRLKAVRRELASVMGKIWTDVLRRAAFSSPLLILDEAHHVKNPATRLASLFASEEAAAESEFFKSGGALGGKFERLLFLTATPFQLGHHELIRILERFEGIDWSSTNKPTLDRAAFKGELALLQEALDEAQGSALRLDRVWGKLKPEHIGTDDGRDQDVDSWWRSAPASGNETVMQVIDQANATKTAMQQAERLLRPWVVRSIKERTLTSAVDVQRRQVLPGASILEEGSPDNGIEIDDEVLLPFLLAGRAQMILAASKRGRALFAEGLSSSFEAYFETRDHDDVLDDDEPIDAGQNLPEEVHWYLDNLDQSLRAEGRGIVDRHPKIRGTVSRVLKLWQAGEKVVVFCHYRATGRALRQHISAQIHEEIGRQGSRIFPGMAESEVRLDLERIGTQFEREGRIRRDIEASLGSIVDAYSARLEPGQRERVVEVMRRFVRTPSFLVRYVDIARADIASAFQEAIERTDLGGLALRKRMDDFCRFLVTHCISAEREQYLGALESIQTGSYYGAEVAKAFDAAEQKVSSKHDKALLLPNVRLVNGEVRTDTRQKLLLAFNTPLFPEVLIASSVLAEGVDLHLNCRHVIHHDLCWNPSTLEQRTGRVDRIGSKAEQVKAPINVYVPYIAATQDEKIFRVVRDRERWFNILMGEKFSVDEASTESLAERLPLPSALQSALTLKLEPDDT